MPSLVGFGLVLFFKRAMYSLQSSAKQPDQIKERCVLDSAVGKFSVTLAKAVFMGLGRRWPDCSGLRLRNPTIQLTSRDGTGENKAL